MLSNEDWRNSPPPQHPNAQPPQQPKLVIHPPHSSKQPTNPAISLAITVVVGVFASALIQLAEDDDPGLSLFVLSLTGVIAFVFAVAAGVEIGVKRAKWHELDQWRR